MTRVFFIPTGVQAVEHLPYPGAIVDRTPGRDYLKCSYEIPQEPAHGEQATETNEKENGT